MTQNLFLRDFDPKTILFVPIISVGPVTYFEYIELSWALRKLFKLFFIKTKPQQIYLFHFSFTYHTKHTKYGQLWPYFPLCCLFFFLVGMLLIYLGQRLHLTFGKAIIYSWDIKGYPINIFPDFQKI